MNKENYVSLRAEDVHKRLITDVALNVDEAPKLLDELTDTDRYQQDHIFRANVETSKVYILFYNGKISEVIKRCTHLIEVAILLEQWELLSFDYNLMANSYFLLGLYEKALEYYYSIINNEREHGLKNTLPVSYANIGLIFINIGLNEKAMEYLRSALRYIEYADEDYLRFKEKKAQILFDIIISATKIDKPDEREIEEIHSKMISITIEGLRNDILY